MAANTPKMRKLSKRRSSCCSQQLSSVPTREGQQPIWQVTTGGQGSCLSWIASRLGRLSSWSDAKSVPNGFAACIQQQLDACLNLVFLAYQSTFLALTPYNVHQRCDGDKRPDERRVFADREHLLSRFCKLYSLRDNRHNCTHPTNDGGFAASTAGDRTVTVCSPIARGNPFSPSGV